MKKTMILFSALFYICSAGAQKVVAHYHIDTNKAQQTIQHFGASDGWSMRYLGLWPEDKQKKIADWLFSTDMDATGKPKGIGLSIWRFNLGAGSAEQGDASQINEGTRTECFLQADGSYDWNKQLGQRRFLQLAKERGVSHFLAFMNSVPVYYTKNGLATNTGRDGTANIKDDCYDDVARFIAKAVKGIEQHDGIHFDYLCPVNEPDGSWNWLGPKQEGSPATNRQVAKLVKETSKEFVKNKLTTEIMVDESSDLRCLLGIHMTDWQRGNAIRSFFTKDSTYTYLGKTKNVPCLILGHSYWTNTPVPYMREVRIALRDTLKKYNARFWQTELCIMGNDEEIGGGGGYDFSMKTALYVARVIHHDMVYANAESWSWWRSVGGDYKDCLIRVYSDDGMKSGYPVDSKLLWTLGNYSRFVRPGAVRYEMTATDVDGQEIPEGYNDPKGIMCSAYKNTDGRWTVVVINYSEDEKPFHLDIDGSSDTKWVRYRTSDVGGENLAPIGDNEDGTIVPPRSVTTFVSE